MSDYNDQPLHRLEPAYLDHYGLDEPPFSALVDERFYFSTADADQRLSLLVHMTQYSDMVLMVLGESGMGKSSLLQKYIKSAHDNWHICRVSANNMMDKDQLLFRIAEDFGIESLPADSAELQEMLYGKMTQLHQNDVLPVIIVDDAHELAVDAISQLFIMAEIKAGDVTMVHIVLFAEPSIDKTINTSSARKIYERIGHKAELTPLDEADTADYILSRMTLAGLREENPFSAKVLRQIHKQSQGVPARINELAHIALDESQGGNEPEYIETDEFDVKTDSPFTPIRVFAVLAIATIAGLGLWQQDRINQLFEGTSDTEITETQQQHQPVAIPNNNDNNPFARLRKNMINMSAGLNQVSPPQATEGKTVTPNFDRIEDPAIAAQLKATRPVSLPPTISRIEPTRLTASGNKQTLILHGENFSAKNKITLSWSGQQKILPRSRIKFVSDKKIRITLSTGMSTDTWTVSIKDPGGKSHTAEFTVIAAKPKPSPVQATGSLTAQQWVQAQPAKNLSLQLLGSHSVKPINQYIQQHKLTDKAVIYKTRHKNKDWYVLLYGSFANQQQAQQVVAQLPASAKTNKPWIRNFASIRAPQKKATKKKIIIPTRQTSTPKLNNIAAHEAWLWSQDPSHYTLQLLGTHKLNNIKKFISQHQLRGKVVYYHTQRDNQPWYALVYGAYPNNKDARSAVKQLPSTIKKLSPWIRNFSAIHAEMGTAGKP